MRKEARKGKEKREGGTGRGEGRDNGRKKKLEKGVPRFGS